MKKPLPGCILCRDCKNKTTPHPLGVLTPGDLIAIGYSGCTFDGENRLTEADRKCAAYKEVILKKI